MAHKTLINGTAYEIKGGMCKVNGTAYSIKKGKTKVGGTAYDIKFGTPITFTVDLTNDVNFASEPIRQFTALEGMTWAEFVDSSYNSEGRFVTRSEWTTHVFYNPTSFPFACSFQDDDTWELTSTIIAGHTYKAGADIIVFA